MQRPDIEQFVQQARDAEVAAGGRLPVPDFAEWATFPFEGELRSRHVADAMLPEAPRQGEGGVGCKTCASPDTDYLWSDADWRVRATKDPTGLPAVLFLEPRSHHDLTDLPRELAASMGTMIWRVDRALMSLGGIARVQLARWGDGGAHLHVWFFPRPAGFVQGRGSFLTMWDDLLPPRPREEWQQTLLDVAAALAANG